MSLEELENDWQIPQTLLFGATVVLIISHLLEVYYGIAIADSLGAIFAQLAGTIIFVLLSTTLMGRIRQIDFGPWSLRILRVAAVVVAATAAGFLVLPLVRLIPFVGAFLIYPIEFLIAFTLIGALFDLNEDDTWYFMGILFIISVFAAVATNRLM